MVSLAELYGIPPTEPFLRPQQSDMINLITGTPKSRSLAVEAPTGIGKSRAALVAAAKAMQSDAGWGAVIATSTRALSHQYSKEIRLAEDLTGSTFHVLSGKVATGCRCSGRGHRITCPWPESLRKARQADVVITNFAMLAIMADGFDLGSRRTVIIDEAHEFAAPREIDDGSSSSSNKLFWQPGDVAEALLERNMRLALISATLNTGLSHIQDPFTLTSAGIPVHVHATLPSPFDWSTQLEIRRQARSDGDWAAFALDQAHSLDSRGKLFITRSHKEKDRIAGTLTMAGFDVLSQADPGDAYGEQAADIANAFRMRPGICVVGTDTLMTGLDVPGDALGNVIVCGPPNLNGRWRDLEEARLRMARTGGSDMALDYFVPNRSMRLAQAIGRGVRSTTDTATVVVGCEKRADDQVYDAAIARFQ